MALSFPLGLNEFFDDLRITVAQMAPYEPRKVDRTAGGTILSASQGDAVWQGTIQIAAVNFAANPFKMEALLSVLDRAGSSFLMYDPRKCFPMSDPQGAILGSAVPRIASLSANNRELSLNDLPPGYVHTAGDLIGWQYASNPTRYALHRLVSGATADGSGATGTFEVTPFIQPGVTVGTSVALVKPVIKAVLVPSPQYGSGRAKLMPGASFDFVQTQR